MKQLNRFYFDQAISIDNALTTNQIIHQLINNLNGVIEFVNNIETDAHEYTDAEISKLKIELEGEISDLNNLLDLRVSELTNLINTKKAEAVSDANGYTDVSIENLKTDYITPIIDRIDKTLERLDLKIDYVDASIRNLVDETKAELIELIKKGNSIIYSGYSGLLTALQNEIHNIYDVYSKFFGLTWNRFHLCFDSATTFLETWAPSPSTVTYPIINVDGNYYHFKFSSSLFKMGISYIDDAMASITFYRTSGNYGDANAVRVAGQVYSGVDVVKNADNNILTVNGVSIESIDYSYINVQLGTYADDTFTATNFFVFSKLNPAEHRKVKITWNTLDYLTDLGVNITYDFINYYFYSDFNDVFGKLILDNSIQYGLNRTLYNFNSTNNAPNNCSVGSQFGQNDLPFLNNTIDYFSEAVKARNDL